MFLFHKKKEKEKSFICAECGELNPQYEHTIICIPCAMANKMYEIANCGALKGHNFGVWFNMKGHISKIKELNEDWVK